MKRRLLLQSTVSAAGLASISSVAGCGGTREAAEPLNFGQRNTASGLAEGTGAEKAYLEAANALETLESNAATNSPQIQALAPLPTWRQGMAVGQWKQIPGSVLSVAPISVKTYPALGATGPASKVVAWCGLAIDTRDSSVYSPAGGGHSDYAGNEVHRIRLSDNAPGWTERRPATPVSQVRASATHYADGRPTSRHSYYGVVCNEQRGRVMVLAGSRWGDGYQIRSFDGFDLSRNDWDPARTYPDAPAAVSMYYGATTVEHKSTGDIYVFANYSVFKWSNASNAWSTLASGSPTYGFEAASAFDTQRNRVLVLGGLGNDRAMFTVATRAAQPVTLSGSLAGALGGTGNGMVYDPVLDAYLLRKAGSGGMVYRINAQTFAVSSFATTAGGSIPEAQNSVYRRFLYVPALSGVVYCPMHNSSMWFLRTA